MAGRKKKERADGLRDLNDEKLANELDEAGRRMFSIRIGLTTRAQTNTSERRKVGRQIARIRTIQRERELHAAFAAHGKK